MTVLRPAAAPVVTTDVVVVGSGAAGLSTALRATGARVLLLTAGELGVETASAWAKGGIAAAVGEADSPADHAADTLAVGWEANDPAIVDLLTAAAPATVRWLEDIGARFARDAGGWMLGREAGHRHDRILHADGDATGRELTRALTAATLAAPHVTVREHTRAVALLVDGGRVVGVLARTDHHGDASHRGHRRTPPNGASNGHAAESNGHSGALNGHGGALVAIGASAVVLATGGSAGAWRDTTNPPGSRGTGLVLAADAGATLADLQYVQFHPTALDCGADPLPLLTEALRGAGATIVDGAGRRFLADVHPDAELAPRDVVARAVWQRRSAGELVQLDLRGVSDLRHRFPAAVAACRAHGLDPLAAPVPVTPAAHYHMGGIAVDASGATDLPGLYAAGEVACTGAHGANRLASNSLLEALVFGERVAAATAGAPVRASREVVTDAAAAIDPRRLASSTPATVAAVRRILTTDVGVLRTADGLRRALDELDDLATTDHGALPAVARMIATAALAHDERRGAHWRDDADPDGAAELRPTDELAHHRLTNGLAAHRPTDLTGTPGAPPRVVVTAPDRTAPTATVTTPRPVLAGTP